MFCSLPMSQTRIGVESGKNSGCISDVWPCGDCKVHEAAYNGDVRVLAYFWGFCIVLRAHGGGKTSPSVERSGDRLGIVQTMFINEIRDVLALGDGKAKVGTISMNF